ncbi:hypothetical protein KUTeg_008972 [Tegillarca granosa]|uniref:Macro domain-containing protein n=1 Tax=Tegillarca granosa TaxID=220873 RepID=A0ABQ9F7Y3_TEGGR|nr:hypothetical protein KUTeg_008972 [Tegillarca granosa]
MLKKIKADVNPAFLELDFKVLEKIQGEIKSKWNVELVLDREKRSMKLEGCNFEDVKKVNSYLESKVEEMNRSENKRTDSIDSDFTGVDILKITPREFDTLMYFWGNEYMRAHKDVKISHDGDQEVFVQCDQTESENLKMEINREIEKIRNMTDTETIFENSQIEKAKSCLQTLQSEFKEVYFFLDKDKLVLHAVGDYNYTLKQTLSHRAKLLTGQIKETKRGRRFAAGEDISVGQNDGHSGQDEYRSIPSSLPSHDSMRSSTRGQNRSTDEKKKFTTKEGIDIYVYSESILQLDVDCIVNAANERLGHGAGVAAVIARGAGYKLEEEGKEYIEQYGPIPVGECCHTTAGKLPYKYVIHTVGPRWNNSMAFKEQEQCKKELQSAIESCFYEADFLRMKSIGVPSVSAGTVYIENSEDL